MGSVMSERAGEGIGNDQEEDDPRTAAIIRRMRLFVGVSTAIMGIGFLTVMSVIVWRLVKHDGGVLPAGPEGAPVVRSLPLPAGSHITGTTSDGEHLFITTESADGRAAVHMFDADSLRYRARIETQPER
jgi:hypothetical protein